MLQQLIRRFVTQPARARDQRPSAKPVALDPAQLQAVAGGLPRGGWTAGADASTQLPRGGW